MNTTMQMQHGHRLVQLGILLFLLGLISGFLTPVVANPRMGLTSHLEGVMNGTFLVVLGLIWSRLALSAATLRVTFWLALYGAFVNWLSTLLAAIWNAGGRMMPLAAPERIGSEAQEMVIAAMLWSLSLAMVAVCVLVLVGLYKSQTGKAA